MISFTCRQWVYTSSFFTNLKTQSRYWKRDQPYTPTGEIFQLPICKYKSLLFVYLKQQIVCHAYLRIGLEFTTPLLQYGDRWRTHRRVFNEYFKREKVPSYERVITDKVHILLGEFIREPASLEDHAKWYAFSCFCYTKKNRL